MPYANGPPYHDMLPLIPGGVPPHVPPQRSIHYKGRDLTFEGIPTSGDKFLTWKMQVQSDVVRAANMTSPSMAQEYIELAFSVEATDEQLCNVPQELAQLDALVASQVMKGLKELTEQSKSTDDAASASFLMTKLNEMQAKAAKDKSIRFLGRH